MKIQSASFQLGCRNQKAAFAVSPAKHRRKEKRVVASPCVLMVWRTGKVAKNFKSCWLRGAKKTNQIKKKKTGSATSCRRRQNFATNVRPPVAMIATGRGTTVAGGVLHLQQQQQQHHPHPVRSATGTNTTAFVHGDKSSNPNLKSLHLLYLTLNETLWLKHLAFFFVFFLIIHCCQGQQKNLSNDE